MDADRELLQKTFEIARDNNRMLHAMRRNAFFGGIFRLIFWVVIIGGPVVFYFYYAKPYLDQMLAAYAGLRGEVGKVTNLTDQLPNLNLEEVLNQLGGKR